LGGRQIVKQEVAKVQTKLAEAEKQLVDERAARAADQATIEQLKLTIAKMQRDQYGAKSEHSERLLAALIVGLISSSNVIYLTFVVSDSW
jgi:hypothetical protein